MTKIKILNADILHHRLEESVNEFIADKNVRDIRYQAFVHGNRLIYSAMILYEEESNGMD